MNRIVGHVLMYYVCVFRSIHFHPSEKIETHKRGCLKLHFKHRYRHTVTNLLS